MTQEDESVPASTRPAVKLGPEFQATPTLNFGAPRWLKIVTWVVFSPVLCLLLFLLTAFILPGNVARSLAVLVILVVLAGLISLLALRRMSRLVAVVMISASAVVYGLGLYGAYWNFRVANEMRAQVEAAKQANAEAQQNLAKEYLGENQDFPDFPWPPPAASASYVLPRNLFDQSATVGQVTDAITTALERKGYVERSFFHTKADGIALVTRLERINDDGSPAAQTDRWPTGWRQHDLMQTLLGLFYVSAGHYRVIVFILQDKPFSQSSERPTGEQAREWLRTGANILPREVAERPFGDGTCTALIYEFASDGAAVRMVESRLTGKDHLEKAGLLALLAKAN